MCVYVCIEKKRRRGSKDLFFMRKYFIPFTIEYNDIEQDVHFNTSMKVKQSSVPKIAKSE